MFSVDNFYNYLTNEYSYPKENSQNILFKFKNDGDRDISNLFAQLDLNIWHNDVLNKNLYRYFGGIFLFDQEPLILENYHVSDTGHNSYELFSKYLSKNNHISYNLSRVQTSIICHSEKNSTDINFLAKKGFNEVYYWYHGLIAQDWFRHWKHFKKYNTVENSKRFGLYVRDGSGSRNYRLHLLEKLTPYANNIHFSIQNTLKDQVSDNVLKSWPLSTNTYNSESSAQIEWDDRDRFKIHIVAETLFDTQKVHLTEKVFKPMVLLQPFILLSGPNSLSYLRDYGFKTFRYLWDESYDSITNTNDRLQKIIALIADLNELNGQEFNKVMEEACNIVQFNREHFYSEKFTKHMLDELKSNMESALEQQRYNFLSRPKNLWMDYLSVFNKNTGYVGAHNKKQLDGTFLYLNKYYPKQAAAMYKYYNHLF